MSDPGQNGTSWGSRLVGGIQVIGGGLEIALGVGGIVLPEPATTVGGVILVAHGADTVVAGFRTLWHGEVQHSYTQQLGTAAALGLGASPQTARGIGTAVDIAAGVGPGMAIGVSRRLAIAGAEQATERVAVAYLHRSALQMGHNAVGVTAGGRTAWVHFAGTSPGRVVPLFGGPGNGYILTELAVTTQQATRASTALQTLRAGAPQTWGLFGPNCTTVATRVLQEAGVVVPAWSRTPYLLHLGVNYGAEITVVAGTAATTMPVLLAPQGAPRPVIVAPPR
ncbi:hypothetical protein [Elioraea tepidiphila]|jgi:hypothetical protein|uniref:hypothetical protein n=1 Tax=Elioraea tepidiphila TaxID=457934 RepID=UPI000381EF50|nr:hypothetical protein [Elioraea tepidiphila]